MQCIDNLSLGMNVEPLGEYFYLIIGTKWELVSIVGIQCPENHPNTSPKIHCFWQEPSRGYRINPQNHDIMSPKHPIF